MRDVRPSGAVGGPLLPVLRQPGRVAPGASLEERRVVTVLFADLVGYTTLAEHHDPENVKRFIESCFERLVADIEIFGGRVDKLLGDAIVALFGAPVAHEDDAERAVRAGLRMQETLARFAAERAGLDEPPIEMRVGINTGEVLVGTLGRHRVHGDGRRRQHRLAAAVDRPARAGADRQRHGRAVLGGHRPRAVRRHPDPWPRPDRAVVAGHRRRRRRHSAPP